MEGPEKHVPKQLQPYVWKKGVSVNPAGRPPGKTLKEFGRDYLMSLPDDEKIEYLASLPTDIVWKMAGGNPESAAAVISRSGSDEAIHGLARCEMDCFAEPVIGRAFARPVGLQ
jgi:hypothetical protein